MAITFPIRYLMWVSGAPTLADDLVLLKVSFHAVVHNSAIRPRRSDQWRGPIGNVLATANRPAPKNMLLTALMLVRGTGIELVTACWRERTHRGPAC